MDEIGHVLHGYREDIVLERADLAAYQWSASSRSEELERWRCLQENQFKAEMLVFESAFRALRLGVT